MAIRGITFSKQAVSSNDDSHIYKVLLGGRKGRTKGCKMTYDANDVYISEGYFFASNRLIEISSMESVASPVVSAGTIYCRLVFEIDLSKSNTTESFDQGYFKILSSTTNYPEITQNDLEDGGNIYHLPFAKFTKTINGIANFVSELESIGSASDLETVYVATNGDDAAGDGSESYPYRTIQHAVNSISKDLLNKTITINVASGTYSENVEISGFYGGTLRLTFGTVSIKTLTVYESCIIMSGTSLTLSAGGNTYGFYCHRGANVICQLPLTVTGSTNGIYAVFGSKFSGNRAITVNSCTYAVVSMYSSYVYISALTGSKNNNGVQASAAIASIGSIETTLATTLYVTSSGGRVYTGAQTSLAAY